MEEPKLKNRLGLLQEWSDPGRWLQSLEIEKKPLRADATDFDRAWRKHSACDKKSLLALACHFNEQSELARDYAKDFLSETKEFFFGDWRKTFVTADGRPEEGWWKRKFNWIEIFERTLLWGSVLREWDYLKQVGNFPEPNSSSGSYKPQERDLYVAWGAFLRGASPKEIEPLLAHAETGRSRRCKLVLAMMRAGLTRDDLALQKALVDWLKHYRKSEFPKQSMPKKITIEGTFFVHWAEMEKMPLNIPEEFADYIVRLPSK